MVAVSLTLVSLGWDGSGGEIHEVPHAEVVARVGGALAGAGVVAAEFGGVCEGEGCRVVCGGGRRARQPDLGTVLHPCDYRGVRRFWSRREALPQERLGRGMAAGVSHMNRQKKVTNTTTVSTPSDPSSQ
jgi:hypothetical protein